MKEIVEFRIPEEAAARYLPNEEGRPLGSSVRLVRARVDSPLYQRIEQLDAMFKRRSDFFFLGWDIIRHYSTTELNLARLLHLKVDAVFEPAGEQSGTIYDESTACPHCGAYRTQVSELVLDLRRVPKGKDIARTIADEVIVGQRLAELFAQHHMAGFDLRPVRHKAHYEDDPIDLKKLEWGRELIRRSEAAGYEYQTWPFYVWLNRPEQKQLAEWAWQEHVALKQTRDRSSVSRQSLPVWYQLIVTSKPVPTVHPTRFGIRPFDDDATGQYRCPLGHVKGLNVLSQLFVDSTAWDGSDISQTEDQIGGRSGVLVPHPMLLISPRLYRLLKAEKVKGCEVEVAHLT